MALTHDTVLSALQQQFAAAITHTETPSEGSIATDQLTLTIERSQIITALQYLKTHPEFQFNFLTDLCGVHYPDNAPAQEFAVVYHLHSWVHNYRLRLKTYCSRKDCSVPSAVPVFPSANWQERETFDFYGIQFAGHPDLRRILNVDEMDFFPLRKEYPLEEQTRTDKNDKMFGR
jgi:NADH-quinone oxidoreductase subunit C